MVKQLVLPWGLMHVTPEWLQGSLDFYQSRQGRITPRTEPKKITVPS